MKTTNEKLIDLLDGQLNAEESDQATYLIKSDIGVAEEMELLKLAVQVVRRDAINEKVSLVREKLHITSVAKPAVHREAVVRSMYKIGLRIAAIFLLIMGAAVLYKYISVSDQSFYRQQFNSYELSTTRGAGTEDKLATAYRNKDWFTVTTLYAQGADKSNKAKFLTGLAEMQLNHFAKAVQLLEPVAQSATANTSYQEDAEYYLSLAYMMNHEELKSVQLLNKIRTDTGHTYYPLVNKVPGVDLKIIQLKNK